MHLHTSDSEREEIVGVKRGHIKRVVSSDSDADMIPVCTSGVSSRSSIPAKKRKIDKTEDDVIPLPGPFILPKHFPQDIEVALRRKALSTKEKQRFISEIASAILRFKRYPSREDYLCVARAVIEKYPFFKSSDGKPYVRL